MEIVSFGPFSVALCYPIAPSAVFLATDDGRIFRASLTSGKADLVFSLTHEPVLCLAACQDSIGIGTESRIVLISDRGNPEMEIPDTIGPVLDIAFSKTDEQHLAYCTRDGVIEAINLKSNYRYVFQNRKRTFTGVSFLDHDNVIFGAASKTGPEELDSQAGELEIINLPSEEIFNLFRFPDGVECFDLKASHNLCIATRDGSVTIGTLRLDEMGRWILSDY